MLSRTADHLYWMARYTERAENLARMLDVQHRMTLINRSDPGKSLDWSGILTINRLDQDFACRYPEPSCEHVIRYMAFDPENTSSIYSCLRLARENAHAVRGTLTSELWETINATWLKIRDTHRSELERELGAFFEWVKFRSHLSRGVSVGTMLQDESFHFMRLGTFLERSDNTARILDVKFQRLLGPSGEEYQGSADYYQWGGLLRSLSAFEIYRKVYRDSITPRRVAELLILRPDMPRSLLLCAHEVLSNLECVANRDSTETQRLAGHLYALLRYGRIEDVFAEGLHEFLENFLIAMNDIGSRISEDFLLPVAA